MAIRSPFVTHEVLADAAKAPDVGALLAESTAVPMAWEIPTALLAWLNDLQHFHGTPFRYLVPDARQLPPESLRLFHIDAAFQQAMVDGALAAASAGTDDDDTLASGFIAAVHDQLADLPGGADRPLTGMLLRSALVRHSPRMEVRAWSTTNRKTTALPVVRRQRLSESVMLVIWQGKPARIELEEPREGTQFGADRVPGTSRRELELRTVDGDSILEMADGSFLAKSKATAAQRNSRPELTVPLDSRPSARSKGVLDIRALRETLRTTSDRVGLVALDGDGEPRDIARQLQQTPFRAVFQGTAPTSSNPDVGIFLGTTVLHPMLDAELLTGILNAFQADKD